MKKNKVLCTTMAFALAAPMFMAPVMATDGKNDGEDTNPDKTIVSYNNSTVIEDPDGAPATWGVEVPKAITFTDNVKSIKADVKLVDLSADGNPGYPSATDAITVKVQSENGYVMEMSDPTDKDPIKYTLGYKTDGTTMTNAPLEKSTDHIIGKLSVDTLKIEGIAIKKGDAFQTGNHTDRLTYTISTTK